MTIKSVNPANGKVIKEFAYISDEELEKKIQAGKKAFNEWKKISLEERIKLIQNLKSKMLERKTELAHLMADEMGKVLKEGEAEIEKCALLCDYYAETAEKELEPVHIDSTYENSSIHFVPQGIIFAIMPWNYPFWQVMRYAIPTLITGNVGVLKHAENVGGCAIEIESLFKDAGFPEGTFHNLFISHSQAEDVIAHPEVRGVTLTGSTRAGKKVASLAGSHVKKTVLELGGSDAYLVLEDADLDLAVEKLLQSRLLNNGQSCIAAKRFIVSQNISGEFISKLKTAIKEYKIGDPKDGPTKIGPLARKDLRDTLHEQVIDSINSGAKLEIGGEIPEGEGSYYPPTIISEVKQGMRAYSEELFGPVAIIITFKTVDEAIEIANSSSFGLGGGIFSRDTEKAKKLAIEEFDSGACFINDFVKSDPKLPFGGVKESGYGRELSAIGLKEFVNIKTVCLS